MSEEFKTEKYDFFDFEQRRISVGVGIRRVDEQNITDGDIEELRQFFNDIGKWESLMKTGISLIEDTGITSISETIREKYQKEIGPEKYNINIERVENGYLARASLSLTREECLKRSQGRSDSGIQLPLEEIVEPVRNITKWRTLIKTINQVGSAIR